MPRNGNGAWAMAFPALAFTGAKPWMPFAGPEMPRHCILVAGQGEDGGQKGKRLGGAIVARERANEGK